MCLIAFSYKNHPVYDLIFAANRDEFYERPTRAARFWDDHSELLAGKDLKEGGTWMGVSKKGKFSALTNYRDPDAVKDNPPSRGHLVLDYLTNGDSPEEYMNRVEDKADRYNGFNLLAGTLENLLYFSNQYQEVVEVEEGIHGLSNHLLDTDWPKVERAKQDLKSATEGKSIRVEALFELLQNDKTAPDEQLPSTGIPKELERAVSPIFIKTERYGTRCSTVLLIDKNGEATFEERRYEPGTQELSEQNRYNFQIA